MVIEKQYPLTATRSPPGDEALDPAKHRPFANLHELRLTESVMLKSYHSSMMVSLNRPDGLLIVDSLNEFTSVW